MSRDEKPVLGQMSAHILQLIAEGQSYEQIVGTIGCTQADISTAAAEALCLWEYVDRPAYSLAAVRSKHPRAYQPWSEEEDARLKQLAAAGNSPAEIAAILERQPSAIRSRLARFEGAP